MNWERIQIFHIKTQLLQWLLLQNQALPCPEPPSFVLPWLSSSEFWWEFILSKLSWILAMVWSIKVIKIWFYLFRKILFYLTNKSIIPMLLTVREYYLVRLLITKNKFVPPLKSVWAQGIASRHNPGYLPILCGQHKWVCFEMVFGICHLYCKVFFYVGKGAWYFFCMTPILKIGWQLVILGWSVCPSVILSIYCHFDNLYFCQRDRQLYVSRR